MLESMEVPMRLFRNSSQQPASANGDAAAPASSAPGDSLGIAGYDGLDAKQLAALLPERSQIELTAIEEHERAGQGRAAVLDKLRYLREHEPVPGYDALSTEQVVTQLQSADLSI